MMHGARRLGLGIPVLHLLVDVAYTIGGLSFWHLGQWGWAGGERVSPLVSNIV